jgi:RsiW-degrading membrane proteinase PrsW (M82 family)
MHGIYVAAVIATVISVLLWGGIFYWLCKKPKNLLPALITLPFSTIVNLLVKKPIYESILSFSEISPKLSPATPLWFLLFVLFLSPLTEEAIKISPLTLKQIRQMIDQSSAIWIGTALGMSFGIGEIWYLAWRFSMVPEFAQYPFYYFTGFINERTVVVYIHGVMTAVAVTGLQKGEKRSFSRVHWRSYASRIHKCRCNALPNRNLGYRYCITILVPSSAGKHLHF